MAETVTYPGGSKSRVNLAGENIRSGTATTEDLNVVEEWRSAHRRVLNTFQAILRNRTRDAEIIVAQRHKRKNTIFGKLQRFPKMKLARMDDIAGCRLIFKDIEELNKFRTSFHKARFNHHRRNATDKYNYIQIPKATGYRGIHDIYEYDVNSTSGKSLVGLCMEIQYRTLVQHAWATAVEVVGFITASQPKFQQGDKRYERAMALASEILARAYENTKGPFPEKSNREVLEEFLQLDKELLLLKTLRGLNEAKNEVADKKNTILIFSETGGLETRSYRYATEALRALLELEKQLPKSDIVLVHADSSEEVRLAFRNYFSDAREFIRLIDEACALLE